MLLLEGCGDDEDDGRQQVACHLHQRGHLHHGQRMAFANDPRHLMEGCLPPRAEHEDSTQQLLEQQGHHAVDHELSTSFGPQAAGAIEEGHGHGSIHELTPREQHVQILHSVISQCQVLLRGKNATHHHHCQHTTEAVEVAPQRPA
eukprot:Skav212853  [mRNA]  locus=scaffold786:18067:27646:- [translate_table: standard]